MVWLRAHAAKNEGMPDHRREKEGVRMAATISREELESKLDREDNFLLVEILPEEQYRNTHLPGAENLPPDAVRESRPPSCC